MKQPELGKRIAELRKAKGLTQEELVEKCNLNVRTLQRIESGEVTPRSYTIKIIFAALDYTVSDSVNAISGRLSLTKSAIFRRSLQFYDYVIDIFNFKTFQMKKLMILSVLFLVASAFLVFLFNSSTKAQSRVAVLENFKSTSSTSKFVQWFNTGQIDSISFRYSENACYMPDQYSTLNDRKGIHEYFQQLYNRGLRFALTKSLSQVISDSIAIDRGIWSVNVNSITVATGTYLTHWQLHSGNWRIVNEMSKSDNLIVREENGQIPQ